MDKKRHLTFEKGHLIFGGGASAPHATPQIFSNKSFTFVAKVKLLFTQL